MLTSAGFRRERILEAAAVLAILVIAAVARFWAVGAGVPHAVSADEPHIVDRALRILRSGDWNPHLFDYPTLVIYLYTGVAIVRFLFGATRGEWSSLDGFSIAAMYGTGRVVAALIGVATVWLTYRLGRELASPRVAAIGALLLAVSPMHVRESHFVLTDVPVTAFATLALWLSVRAAHVRQPSAYGIAGAAAGLAAAAKYNGIVAAVPVLAAWLLHDRFASGRWQKLAAALGALSLVFVVACPYALLDIPHFLDGVAAQLSKDSAAQASGEAAYLLYLRHLSIAGWLWLPLAASGAVVALVRSAGRTRWMGVVAFAVAYYYTLPLRWVAASSHALPLVPPLCLFVAVAIDEGAAALSRWLPGTWHWRRHAPAAALTALIVFTFVAPTVRWLDQQQRPDTRNAAATWMRDALPRGSSLAVEGDGPTYLDAAGFRVRSVALLSDRAPDWYRANVDYLVISSTDAGRYADYTAGGTTVYQVVPTPQRWGPPIRVVKIK